jgi:hypothetical protein
VAPQIDVIAELFAGEGSRSYLSERCWSGLRGLDEARNLSLARCAELLLRAKDESARVTALVRRRYGGFDLPPWPAPGGVVPASPNGCGMLRFRRSCFHESPS